MSILYRDQKIMLRFFVFFAKIFRRMKVITYPFCNASFMNPFLRFNWITYSPGWESNASGAPPGIKTTPLPVNVIITV